MLVGHNFDFLGGYLVVTVHYLVVTGGYCLLLLIPTFSMNDLKPLNLHLGTNLHQQQNKETQQTEQLAISRLPTDSRPGKRKERKLKKITQEIKEINKKICYACESDSHEMKDCDSGKISLLLTEQVDK